MTTTRADIRRWEAELTQTERSFDWIQARAFKYKAGQAQRIASLRDRIAKGTAQLDAAAARKPAPIGIHAELARVNEQYTSLITLVERLVVAADEATVPEEALALRVQLEEARQARERARHKRIKIRTRLVDTPHG